MAGTIGTILAVVGILNYFTPIMSILSAMIPPVAGVMIASYWVIHKGKTDSWQEVEGVNRLGVFSWLVGAVIACMPVVFSLFPALPALPNQPMIGIIISFVIYYVGYRVSVQKRSYWRNIDEIFRSGTIEHIAIGRIFRNRWGGDPYIGKLMALSAIEKMAL